MKFQLHLPGFEGGPPDLLQCVERQTLNLDMLSIADMTGQFSQHMADDGWTDLFAAGEFLAVAARLMVMKSELLLPRVTEPACEETLIIDETLAVRRDRSLRVAGQLRELEGNECFAVRPVETPVPRIFESQDPGLLLRVWADMKKRPRAIALKVTAPAFLRLEVALSRLLRRLRRDSSFSFSSVLRGASRADAVIHFLALLELVRRKDARARQEQPFGEIDCDARTGTDDTISRAG